VFDLSYSGHIEGSIYSHCWFYESARRSFEHDGYGDICGGITAIALTAFMVESYLNFSCEKIFNPFSRADELLSSPPPGFHEIISDKSLHGIDPHERVAIAYGFNEQKETLIKAFDEQISKSKKNKFKKLCNDKSFYEIDDELRFSPYAKFYALSETLYNDGVFKKNHRDLIKYLFSIRNTLAHGRSEYVKKTFSYKGSESVALSSELVPPLQADWQEKCSIENAKKHFIKSCEVINLISFNAFKDESPFQMPTQIGSFRHA
jgi:hypothetical protein|tara:strand:- start:1245 stop:2030 length:786 start_codon:yes stop_codon:yes gene_type:complete